MIGNARRYKAKAERLLQLYSLWHETHREDVRRQCLSLLGELLSHDPNFSLRREFQIAF